MPGILMSRMARSGRSSRASSHRLVAATGLADDLVALLLEGLPQVEADDGLVLGDQHASRQRCPPFRAFHSTTQAVAGAVSRR